MTPKISIITVTYNAAAVLEETILSVINQTYANIEYIIIDGGSTDRTLDIIKKYEDKISGWISETDKGIYDAMNKGLDMAKGDWLNFMNAGDFFRENDIIEKVSQKMTENGIIYYGDVFFTGINKKYWGKFNKYKLAIGNICHQSIFYPQTIYKKHRYDIKYKIFADYYYNLNIYDKVKFEYLNLLICDYDMNGVSASLKDNEFNNIVNSFIREKLGLLPFISRIIWWKLVSIKRKSIK